MAGGVGALHLFYYCLCLMYFDLRDTQLGRRTRNEKAQYSDRINITVFEFISDQKYFITEELITFVGDGLWTGDGLAFNNDSSWEGRVIIVSY